MPVSVVLRHAKQRAFNARLYYHPSWLTTARSQRSTSSNIPADYRLARAVVWVLATSDLPNRQGALAS